MDQAEDHGNKQQGGDGGEDQTTDYRTAQRRVLLLGQRQGQHADDHRQGRHAHRAEARVTGLQRGLERITMFGQALTAEANHQD